MSNEMEILYISPTLLAVASYLTRTVGEQKLTSVRKEVFSTILFTETSHKSF